MNNLINFIKKNKKNLCYLGCLMIILNGWFLSGFLSLIVSIFSIVTVIYGADEAFKK
jgi:hypothetical protein